jgi:DNA-binding transcriptional ArsR family regulator
MDEVQLIRDPKAIRVATESTRRKILSLLRLRGMTVSEVAAILEKDQSTIYRHMEKLRDAGLVVPSGERKVHHIPEKVFTRTAKIFLLAPDLSTTMDEVDLGGVYGREEVRRMLRALERLGYVEKSTPDLVSRTRDLILHIDDAIRKDVERARVEEMEIHTLWRLEMLLLLIRMRRDEGFRRRITEFLDGLV